MKITGINIEVKEMEENGKSSLFPEITKVELESHTRRKSKISPLYCHFTIDLESGVDVSFEIEISYREGMPLDTQWQKIVSEAKIALNQAANSLPAEDISKYVDLVGTTPQKA